MHLARAFFDLALVDDEAHLAHAQPELVLALGLREKGYDINILNFSF